MSRVNDRSALLVCDPHQTPLGAVRQAQFVPVIHGPYGYRPDLIGVTGSGFNGEFREPELGHYLLGNSYRAYNPALMRFNSPDKASPFARGGLNAYACCLGDPVNLVDRDGQSPWPQVVGQLRKLFDRVSKRLGRGKGMKRLRNSVASSEGGTRPGSPVAPPRQPGSPLTERPLQPAAASVVPNGSPVERVDSQEQLLANWVQARRANARQVPVFEASDIVLGPQITQAGAVRDVMDKAAHKVMVRVRRDRETDPRRSQSRGSPRPLPDSFSD